MDKLTDVLVDVILIAASTLKIIYYLYHSNMILNLILVLERNIDESKIKYKICGGTADEACERKKICAFLK